MHAVHRLLGVALSAALLVAAIITALEAALLLAGAPAATVPRARWADWLQRTSWNDRAVVVSALLVGLAGLVVTGSALIGRQRRLTKVLGGRAWVTQTTLERTIRRSTQAIVGPGSVTVSVGRNTAHVRAAAPPSQRGEIEHAIKRALAMLGMADPLLVTVETNRS